MGLGIRRLLTSTDASSILASPVTERPLASAAETIARAALRDEPLSRTPAPDSQRVRTPMASNTLAQRTEGHENVVVRPIAGSKAGDQARSNPPTPSSEMKRDSLGNSQRKIERESMENTPPSLGSRIVTSIAATTPVNLPNDSESPRQLTTVIGRTGTPKPRQQPHRFPSSPLLEEGTSSVNSPAVVVPPQGQSQVRDDPFASRTRLDRTPPRVDSDVATMSEENEIEKMPDEGREHRMPESEDRVDIELVEAARAMPLRVASLRAEGTAEPSPRRASPRLRAKLGSCHDRSGVQ